ncbi:MAG: hypothetical protein UX08_C0013G0018 [Candidatus Collierbacteria bacterium GW2011_GWB1_45_35]|uniref:Uncharacterized protein n=2 Tax=Candidatus Collieribacteriota TaxID=1752725 RepID=A0A0G1NR66_9BACT|nr:MAG: hypothetical protein UW48_C0008G0018 [Microgenomates group bacterium GW2011_GWC1_44_23]KKT86689.1 MAG: hypothetical protein UW84_C0004G0004 [Candidatus Collierbacteria bacterium GW2011_GWA2_44_99]KKT95351.1 MAG: hypothetical protein UW96_C0008G0018 [Candidatus Collierbacteria bacterium GW2011_GWA1_45_15]KKT99599.1 MAG: hypothetical protein UX01_C0009G0029 [Candidatus Collierbacteria bacterium GW2011_GWB2_45_17]KKU04928.1 MAG: hypothetical protein UX08_C0013G0018 [Candidatus Collierbacte
MKLSRLNLIVLVIFAIVAGAFLALTPKLFTPPASRMSFYVYIDTTVDSTILELSPIFGLNGHLPSEMRVEIIGYEGAVQATIPFAPMTLPRVEVKGGIVLMSVRVTSDNSSWGCIQGKTDYYTSTQNGRLLPEIRFDCTKN